MNVSAITNHLPKAVHTGALVLKKYSPAILTVSGIVLGGSATIVACRSTLKVNDILDEHDRTKIVIDEMEEKGGSSIDGAVIDYTAEDAKSDRIKLTIRTGMDIFKLYAPAIGLGVGSVTCLLASYGIMSKRNAAIAAAYSLVSSKFTEYRERVIEDQGAEKDQAYFHGLKSETMLKTTCDENGKKKKEKVTVNVVDPNTLSPYAKFFDEASPKWVADPEMNLMFLRAQQNYANDLLHARGHIFLNEIYDMIGVPRTREGAVVGWVAGNDGDDFVDFGIYSPYNEQANDFVNGYERSILLDFNVDGIIYDLI